MIEEAEFQYVEAPAWDGVGRFSFSYVFELHLEGSSRSKNAPPRAYRLESIFRAVDPDCAVGRSSRTDDEQAGCTRVFKDLFEPVTSFHDDITTGGPGRGGRPLVFLGRAPDDDDEPERVALERPATWTYRAEGANFAMRTPGDAAARTLTFNVRDSFFVFESGRIYYVLSLTPDRAAGSRLNEYATIQMLKLAHPHFGTQALRDTLRFSWGDDAHDLAGLAAARLADMAAATDGPPNGLRDVLHAHVLDKDERLRPPSWGDLLSAVVGIDDAGVFADAEHVAATEDVLAAAEAPVLEHAPSATPEAHVPPGHPRAAARALALAGVLQAVPDFPFQDGSEIWDSTRPVSSGSGFALFSHPKFLVEIGSGWRSLEEGRGGLGQCPYLLLTWIVAAHDEALAAELEDALDRVIYGGDQDDLLRAEPLRGLIRTFRALQREFLPGPSRALRESLENRLDIFRRLNIHRSRRIFRYEKEARTLTLLNDSRGTSDRFDRATEVLDRYEALVEDVQDLGRMASDKRLNMFLALVAGLSIVSALADLTGLADIASPLRLVLPALGLVAVVVLAWILLTKIRR